MYMTTFNEEAVTLNRKEGYMGDFGGKNGKRENAVTILNSQKKKIKETATTIITFFY